MNDALLDKITELFKCFPQPRGFDPDTIALYAQRLSTLPVDRVVFAIDRLIDTSRFLPTIAEIKEAAVLGPLGEGLADEAWVEVQREARRVGFNRPRLFHNGVWYDPEKPRFSSPVVEAAAKAVGWQLICEGDNSQGFVRMQFVKAFKALAERETKAKQAGIVPVDGEALPAGEDRVIALGQNGAER